MGHGIRSARGSAFSTVFLWFVLSVCNPAAAQQTFYDAYEVGLAHERSGRWTEAAEAFSAAVALRPEAGRNIATFGRDVLEVYDPYFHLARAFLELGRTEDAVVFLGRARSAGISSKSDLDELAARLGEASPRSATPTAVPVAPTQVVVGSDPTRPQIRRDTPVPVTKEPEAAPSPVESATPVLTESVAAGDEVDPAPMEVSPSGKGGGLVLLAIIVAAVVVVVLLRRRATPGSEATPDFDTTPTRRVETGPERAEQAGLRASKSLSEERIGPYRLIDRLGRGGMATTFRAEHTGDGRVVALKIPHDHLLDDTEFAERFLREGALGAAIHHPNIIRIFEAGTHEGVPFIAMELVEGETLEARLTRSGELPAPEALEIARGVALALDYAHVKGVVHRDIKPDNVMLLPDGTIKVMDFGIARVASAAGLTATNTYLGTPFYSAPEAIDPEDVGPQSDLYSLGIVLYRLLSNRVPFEAPSPLKVVELHRTTPLPPFEPKLRVPERVQEFVAKLTAKRKSDRYPSAEVFLHDLNRYLSGGDLD